MYPAPTVGPARLLQSNQQAYNAVAAERLLSVSFCRPPVSSTSKMQEPQCAQSAKDAEFHATGAYRR